MVVDTISVRFPATDQLLDWLPEARMQRIVDDQTGEITLCARGGKYAQAVGLETVEMYASSRSGSPRARVTFSAPKVLDGHNTEGACLGLIPDLVDVVLEHLGENLPDVPSWRDVELVRLDLVRDFRGLRDVSRTLEAISNRPVPRGGRHAREHSEDNRLVYFRRGFRRSWKTRGYDKAHQLKDLAGGDRRGARQLYVEWASASQGRLRYELELGRDLLMRKGMTSVAELQDEKALRTLAENYFDLVNFSAVTGAAAPIQELLADLRARGELALERNLAVYLAYQVLGVDPPLSRHTKSRARRLVREYPLSGDDFVATGEPRRLDFESGTELVGDEALCVPASDVA